MKVSLKSSFSFMCLILCLIAVLFPNHSALAKKPVDVAPALKMVQLTRQSLNNKQTEQAHLHFRTFMTWWGKNRTEIETDSADASIDLSQAISETSLNLFNHENTKASSSLADLLAALQDYQSGLYGPSHQKTKQSLSAYITKLEMARQSVYQKNWSRAQIQVQQLQRDWLSVEGDVVSQSQSVYTNSEKNLVMIASYLNDQSARERSGTLLNEMIDQLKPLVSSSYSMWDAAFIPIREGLEALLVIGALLMFAKKSSSRPAKIWIWSGTLLATLLCLIIGGVVTLIFSVGNFGNYNSLINGWSGVAASVLLFYVGYWLHRHSDIRKWNQFLKAKTEQAMGRGRMFSLALLAFIAVLREGMETVIFLIGMAGRMPVLRLIIGISVGFGILIIIGFLMLKFGVMLPLKPFFLVSSLIVFYLCFKFMGSGIHSLQMANILPSDVSDYLPSVDELSIFPSWYSSIPQMVFLILIAGLYLSVIPFHHFKHSK